jgi:hypothetical protein
VKTRIILLLIACLFIFSCSNQTVVEEKKVDTHTVDDTVVSKYSSGVVSVENSTNIYTILCQEWMQEDDAADLEAFDDNSSLILSIRTFNFYNDGSFVKNVRSAWSYGKWTYNNEEKLITLNYEDEKGSDKYKITAVATDELNITNKGLNTSTILKFIGNQNRMKAIAEEPFHLSNNQWRIPPIQKETDEEIKNRLKSNLNFFVLFYKSVIVKNDKVISFYGLPSCLKWYGGGIYMEKKEDLNEAWLNCFYNKEQAMKAYTLMEKVMSKKYTWPKENIGWVKKNLFVLEQMVKNLETIN